MTAKTDTKKKIDEAKAPAPLKRRGNVVYAVNPFMEGEQRPSIKPKLKRITNRRGDMLEKRRPLMQEWADFLTQTP